MNYGKKFTVEKLIEKIGNNEQYKSCGANWGDFGDSIETKNEILTGMFSILLEWWNEKIGDEIDEEKGDNENIFCNWVDAGFQENFKKIN